MAGTCFAGSAGSRRILSESDGSHEEVGSAASCGPLLRSRGWHNGQSKEETSRNGKMTLALLLCDNLFQCFCHNEFCKHAVIGITLIPTGACKSHNLKSEHQRILVNCRASARASQTLLPAFSEPVLLARRIFQNTLNLT